MPSNRIEIVGSNSNEINCVWGCPVSAEIVFEATRYISNGCQSNSPSRKKKNGGIAHHENEKLGHVGPNHRPQATHCRISCPRQRNDDDAPTRVEAGHLFESHPRSRHRRAYPNRGDDVQACVVFHDPDDTDSQRRFKMAFMSPRYENHIAAAFSPDGIRGREAEKPMGEYLEMGGGVRFHGIYYVTGQGCHHPPPARQLILEGSPARVFLNVDGIGPYSRVAVEVLNQRFAVLPQYAKANCLSLEASGLRREVRWRGRKRVETDVNSVRLRVHFEGVRAEDVKLYAVYLEAAP